MSVTTFPSTPLASFAPHPMRWTVEEFHRVYNDPLFEGRRFMLIEGEVFEMPIPNPPHSVSLGLVEESLRAILPQGIFVRNQMPLVLGQKSDPMPDLAIVRGSPRDFASADPQAAELVVEIADSSLAYDLHEKASLYAASNIAEYWFVDLVHRQLIVHRSATADGSQPFRAKYSSVTVLNPAASISPLVSPAGTVQVRDMLP